MSGDEVAVLLASLVLAGVYWFRWLGSLLTVASPPGTGVPRLLMAAAPPLVLAGLFHLLTHWASFDVIGDPTYIGFYLILGAAWLAFGAIACGLLGISMRDDVCERGNAAAAWALAGALFGLGAAFAGANVGDGPGWWCVAFAGGLATVSLLAGWMALSAFGGITHSVTVDRDQASGIRLGAYLAGAGVLLGRAAAGDWTSALRTVIEFASGWPVLPLTLLALGVERAFRPSKERPAGSILLHGVIPALLYAAFAWVAFRAVGPVPDSGRTP